MNIQPWREIAIPHQDVLKGTFQEAEFAADISQVHQGKAPAEYQDPVQFFARTFITEGMALLLDSVVKRLVGQSGDPIIQLQTAFGGGKTHTMLAVYHLAKGTCPTSELHGIAPILDQAGIIDLPKAKIAVIDGINLAVSEPKTHGAIHCHTLWGELAWQLNGETGYALVRHADEQGTSPDKDTVIQLLTQSAPCVILMDELVAFYRQFQEGRSYPAGSFETNMTFIQALTEGIKSVPRAIMLASLPDSQNAGEGRGQVVLAEIENYVRRLHKIWKPVTKDEAFSIVRRRLFDRIDNQLAMEANCRACAEYYITNQTDLPKETQNGRYLERLKQAYPIHPEIFDRLYEDWSTLARFQRTRGVLQLLAQVVHRLWKDGNSDIMIMPGSLPLYDVNVRNKCLDFLTQGWDSVIDQDIDGEHSKPAEIDDFNPVLGKIQAGRRTARSIFLGSAPDAGGKMMIRGIELERILLGVAQPGQAIGHYKDAVKRLVDRLNYLNNEQNRYWFDIRPNLRREMETRKYRFNFQEDVLPLLQTRVGQVLAKSQVFSGLHIFADSSDIPDGAELRLVVLPPNKAYSRGAANTAFAAAETILRNRGDQPRQRQNRLLFLVNDYEVASRLSDQICTFLAWVSIIADIEAEKIVLNNIQIRQAQQQYKIADESISLLIREGYRWLLCPSNDVSKNKPVFRWDTVLLTTTATNLMAEIEHRMREQDWLITAWSPIHLAELLNTWYFKDGIREVSALKVWQDSCNYLYLPRLLNNHVFEQAITKGIETEDFFGYAVGKEGDSYLGFALGRHTTVTLDPATLLIHLGTARAYKTQTTALLPVAKSPSPSPATASTGTQYASVQDNKAAYLQEKLSLSTDTPKQQFYATISLNPITAKMDFAAIMDEVVEQFSTQVGVNAKINIEINATSPKGFDNNMQRSIKENCTVLKFSNVEFE